MDNKPRPPTPTVPESKMISKVKEVEWLIILSTINYYNQLKFTWSSLLTF